MTRVYLFKGFERFWHWTQAALIILMLLTGFEIHGAYKLMGWEKAVHLHTTAAWALIGLWLFAIFWHFTTGEWRQYIPTTDKVGAMMKYYAYGIFTNAPNPFHVTQERKHNPLQRLVYLAIKVLINPLIWVSGLLYLFYKDVAAAKMIALTGLTLGQVALVHTAAAFMMLIYLIVHIYLSTAGHTPMAHIKAMITGWEDLDHEPNPKTVK
jgi:thiosulfate reductase cytochrome b subunit